MVFSRRHSRAIKFPPLCLGSTPLELVHSYKYLGVTLTSYLSWSEHIQFICVKSKKLIGLLYRRFYGNADPATILILYGILVRPHLEYACQVWSPYTQRDKDLLENVQKFALRMSFRQWNASYPELLNHCNISTLTECRLYLSLCLMYKITSTLPSRYFHSQITWNITFDKYFIFLRPTICQNKCISALLCSLYYLLLELTPNGSH